jgi:alpha-ketoglutarate-dependent taurine dioxygenase
VARDNGDANLALSVCTEELSRAVAQSGWALLEGVRDGDGLIRLGRALGSPVAPHGRCLVQRLSPTDRSDAPANTYSSRYGRGAFPFHTDYANWTTPPRYLLMRSVGSVHSAPTLLLDSRLVSANIAPALRAACFRARASQRWFACNVLSRYRGRPLFRWDPHAMQPLDALAKDARVALCSALSDPAVAPAEILLARTDQVLILDNWRMVHARPDTSDISGRCLERVLVLNGEF